MAEDQVFPGWRYGPNGQSGIFTTPEEVPEGWTNNHNDWVGGKLVDAPASAKPPREVLPLTRKQIIADLSERKLEFDATKPTADLYDQLVAAIEETA